MIFEAGRKSDVVEKRFLIQSEARTIRKEHLGTGRKSDGAYASGARSIKYNSVWMEDNASSIQPHLLFPNRIPYEPKGQYYNC